MGVSRVQWRVSIWELRVLEMDGGAGCTECECPQRH